MRSIFYSWQSDRPAKVTRNLIREAISAAIEQLNAELQDAPRPSEDALEIDHDTRGLPGSPDISAAILAKIDDAAVFIADVTTIGVSDEYDGRRAKKLSNPNVLIELGYAKKALTTARVIQIWNTHFNDCNPNDLPFDMRGRRGPIAFSLAETATAQERRDVLGSLARSLKGAIEQILAITPVIAIEEPWALSDDSERSLWPGASKGLLVNESQHGSGFKYVETGPRTFVRILPHRWTGSDDLDRHDNLLAHVGGFSWGGVDGGTLTYPGSVLYGDTEEAVAVTKRFHVTGEVWATRSSLTREIADVQCIFGNTIAELWAQFLAAQIHFMADGGGQFPFRVRLGLTGLRGLHWPSQSFGGANPPAALTSDFETSDTLASPEPEELWGVILRAWKAYRKIFSLPEPKMQEMQSVRRYLNG